MKTNLVLPAMVFALVASAPWAAAADLSTRNLPKAVHEAVYSAQKALDKGRYEDAEETLRTYLEKHPDDPHPLVYYFLGNSHRSRGNWAEAREAYRKGLELQSGSFILCLNSARMSHKLGKHRETGALFEKAHALADEKDGDLLYQAAAAYAKAEAYQKAGAALEKALKGRQKASNEWLQLLVRAYMKTERWSDAEAAAVRLLGQNPLESGYWKLLAQLRINNGNDEGAISALEIAAQRDALDSSGWRQLADLYVKTGLPLQAAHCLEKAYGSELSAERCDELAKLYLKAHRHARAIEYLDRALDEAPSAARYLKKGRALYRMEQWQKAAKALQECARLDPHRGECRLLLGFCAWETGDFQTAKEAFSRAVETEEHRDRALEALAALEAWNQAGKGSL